MTKFVDKPVENAQVTAARSSSIPAQVHKNLNHHLFWSSITSSTFSCYNHLRLLQRFRKIVNRFQAAVSADVSNLLTGNLLQLLA